MYHPYLSLGLLSHDLRCQRLRRQSPLVERRFVMFDLCGAPLSHHTYQGAESEHCSTTAVKVGRHPIARSARACIGFIIVDLCICADGHFASRARVIAELQLPGNFPSTFLSQHFLPQADAFFPGDCSFGTSGPRHQPTNQCWVVFSVAHPI